MSKTRKRQPEAKEESRGISRIARLLPFVDKIVELRLERNLTQAEIAKMIGISTAALHYIEIGKVTPSLRTLYKMSRVVEKIRGK